MGGSGGYPPFVMTHAGRRIVCGMLGLVLLALVRAAQEASGRAARP